MKVFTLQIQSSSLRRTQQYPSRQIPRVETETIANHVWRSVGAGEAQWIKNLPQKYEERTLDPQHP